MPKRVRVETPGEARLLTFSCYRHLPLLQPEWARDAIVDQLALTKGRLGFLLYAWVVMPDHLHLLMLPDVTIAEIPRVLMSLKSRTGVRILERLRQTGTPPSRLWQPGGGHDRNITTHRQFLEAVDYIENNPVVKGLVARPEEYRWSSAGCAFLGRDSW